MAERRILTLLVVIVGCVALLGIGFGAGRASKSDDDDSPQGASARATRSIDGVAVGVAHTRSGALAAADNYVATATETAIQAPRRYERLVRTVYSPAYQAKALREASRAREGAPSSVELYARGGKTLVIVGARRMDSFSGARASVTSWVGGFTWGPERKPGQNWSIVETDLRWDGQRWRVDRLDAADRPAPAPTTVTLRHNAEATTPTFERELRAMTAPVYGSD